MAETHSTGLAVIWNHNAREAAMKDFPSTLRLSAARDTLAQAIYYGSREAFSLPGVHWDALLPEVRQHYRDEALAALERVKPHPRGASSYFEQAATIAREAAAKVIGAIAPKDEAVTK